MLSNASTDGLVSASLSPGNALLKPRCSEAEETPRRLSRPKARIGFGSICAARSGGGSGGFWLGAPRPIPAILDSSSAITLQTGARTHAHALRTPPVTVSQDKYDFTHKPKQVRVSCSRHACAIRHVLERYAVALQANRPWHHRDGHVDFRLLARIQQMRARVQLAWDLVNPARILYVGV